MDEQPDDPMAELKVGLVHVSSTPNLRDRSDGVQQLSGSIDVESLPSISKQSSHLDKPCGAVSKEDDVGKDGNEVGNEDDDRDASGKEGDEHEEPDEVEAEFLKLHPDLTSDFDVWASYNEDKIDFNLSNEIICDRLSRAWSEYYNMPIEGPDMDVLVAARAEKRTGNFRRCTDTDAFLIFKAKKAGGSKTVRLFRWPAEEELGPLIPTGMTSPAFRFANEDLIPEGLAKPRSPFSDHR